VNGIVLRTFTDVWWPRYSSVDSNGDILVADLGNHRILLLNSRLQLERVLINTDSQVKLWEPRQLYLNELSSELYVLHRVERKVLHRSNRDDAQAYVISKFILR